MKYTILYYLSNFITLEKLIIKLKEAGFFISERELRRIIRDMIFSGYPIISECREQKKGYKLEKDINKILENAEKLKKRGIKIIERAERLKKIALELQQGQLLLFNKS